MKNKLSSTYIIALTVIALVIIVSQILVQRSIARSTYDSRTINISGRQSMLSQKISKSTLEIERAKNEKDFSMSKRELLSAAKIWEKSHNALQYGNKELKLDNVNNSEETFLKFLEAEQYFEKIKNAISKVGEIDWSDTRKDEKTRAYANQILKNEEKFSNIMNEITFLYDEESRNRLSKLKKTEYILLGIALLFLVLEALFVFRPMIKRINDNTKKLLKQGKSLKKSLLLQRKERARVEYLNKQAKSVFQNVGQGLFLLNDKFLISELYSKKIDQIFEQENLAKTNFLHLMRTRLVKRDQDALQMFVKHLFNPDIDEEMLSQLNPVESVKIHSENQQDGTEIQTRYLRIGFNRIKDKTKIYSVLVTITDETESVLLQQKINESEAKNKRDSEQLLSILSIDPIALRDFLDNCHNQIDDISSRYENDKEKNFSNTLNYTFNTIHNLKGNASLIDLKILVSKFDEIETTITELRSKTDVSYKDFISILFGMNEVKTITTNMQNMLVRITEVNKKFTEGEKTDGNSKFEESLRKGLKNFNKDSEVLTNLNFQDNGIIIPERYRLIIKDITIQLFRNSIAHGIEKKVDERASKGKTSNANIKFMLENTPNNDYCITYEDDGQGLDIDKIKQKAISKNIISEEDFENLSENEIFQLIFRDDFSTSENVDELSGRGQGMSLIKEIIEKNNGSYEIQNRKGEFFKIKIILPKDTVKILEPA